MEASPDIGAQLNVFDSLTQHEFPYLPAGIFVSHAHIGHYTGLMYLGKEAMNAKAVPVFTMPRMQKFLNENGPWSQLVSNQNIALMSLRSDSTILLSKNIRITPFTVPHRDEFSETVGFRVQMGKRKVLFIPDIDKWHSWERDIRKVIADSDLAFLDGTFFDTAELPGRDMSKIPHPLVSESIQLFDSADMLKKVIFIHFNHTNRLMWDASFAKSRMRRGCTAAKQAAWY